MTAADAIINPLFAGVVAPVILLGAKRTLVDPVVQNRLREQYESGRDGGFRERADARVLGHHLAFVATGLVLTMSTLLDTSVVHYLKFGGSEGRLTCAFGIILVFTLVWKRLELMLCDLRRGSGEDDDDIFTWTRHGRQITVTHNQYLRTRVEVFGVFAYLAAVFVLFGLPYI